MLIDTSVGCVSDLKMTTKVVLISVLALTLLLSVGTSDAARRGRKEKSIPYGKREAILIEFAHLISFVVLFAKLLVKFPRL